MSTRSDLRSLTLAILAVCCFLVAGAASAQQFDVTYSPKPIPNVSAGSTFSITVTGQKNASTPPSATQVTWNLDITDNGGQHVGITTDTPKTSTLSGNQLTPVTITISVPPSVPAGHYSGPLTGHYQYSPGNFTDYEFDIVQFNVVAAAPGFSFALSNNAPTVGPNQPATVTVTTTPDPGFNSTVTYQFSGAPSYLTVTPLQQQVPPPYQPFNLQFSVNASDPAFHAGTVPIGVTASGGGTTLNHTIDVTVTAPAPDFALQANPSTVTLSPSASQPVTVSTQGLNGFSGPITLTASSSRSDVTVTPASATVNAGASQPFTIAAGPSAAAGSAAITFTGTAGGMTHAATVSANILAPSPQPDFTVNVSANPPQIYGGGATTLTFNVIPINGFNAPAHITPVPISGVVFSPAAIDVTLGTPRTMTATVSPTTVGAVTMQFTATSGTIQHTPATQATITVLPASPNGPTITSVTPSAIVAGAPPTTLRVAGTNFVSGATVFSDSPFITVQRTTVLSSQLADVVVSASRDTNLRMPYSLRLRNPNGATTPNGVALLVTGRDSLTAPTGASGAVIRSPIEGQFVANNQAVYPVGEIATTGSGALFGEWRLDGHAYETFVTQAQGGLPVEVHGKQPIPAGAWGEHTLTLAVAARLEDLAENGERAIISPTITILSTIDSGTKLSIYEPADQAIVGREIPAFRWTMVTGVTGFRLYLGTPENPALHVIRISDATGEWRPTKDDLRRFGIHPGVYVWHVAPMYPGNVEGPPSETRALIILPDAVALRIDSSNAAALKWAGGSAGLVYRLDFFAEDGRPVFHATTVRSGYRVPRATARGAFSFRVNACTPDGELLGQSLRRVLTFAAADDTPSSAAPQISGMTPADLATINTTQPEIGASWSAAVDRSAVVLFVDDNDVTPVSVVSPTSIRYGSLLPLTPGKHTVRLTAGSSVTTWSFTVDAPAPAPGMVTKPNPLHADYTLTPNGNITVVHHDSNNTAHAQFTGQGDVDKGEGLSTKFNGDLGYRAGTKPQTVVQESRNWITQFGAGSPQTNVNARIGYTAPDFTDQAEYLTSGAARTGAIGKVVTRGATISYYQPVNTAIHGVMTGNTDNLRIRSAAIATPDGKAWSVRAIGLEVTDPGNATAAGSSLRTVGLFAKYDLSPKLSLLGEVAQGTLRPECGSLSADAIANGVPCPTGSRSGHAFKLGFSGMVANTTYGLIVREVGANFVNPANRGFTIGGVTDRLSADFNLSRMLGKASVSATLRRQDGGRSHDSTGPRASQNAFNLNVSMPFTQRVNFNASLISSQDRADASQTFYSPKADRSNGGINATLSETLGKFSLSQTAGVQKASDHMNPLSDMTTSNANLSVSGSPLQMLNLSGTAAFTRSVGAATMGTTNQYTLSFQPSLALFGFLSLQPRIGYNRSTNDLTHYTSSGDQYAAAIQFSPTWKNSMISAQASADWNGSTSENPFSPRFRQFGRRYQATMNVRWGGFHGGTAPAPPNPLPGATPTDVPPPGAAATTK